MPPALRLLIALVLAVAGTAPARALHPERPVRLLRHVWYEDQLPQNTVLSIAQRADGTMWFATYAGLVRHSGAAFETVDAAFDSSAVTAVAEARDGTLWVGTLNGGLYRSAGRTFERVALPAAGESVFAMAEDAEGALWLASDAGLLRRAPHGAWRVFGPDDGVPRVPVRALAAAPDGALWVALDGVGVLRHEKGRIERYGVDAGLPSVAAFAVRADRAGTVWVGTQAGLVRWRDGRFERPDGLAPLDGMRIYALQGDREGSLWLVAQERGLCRWNGAALDCRPGMRGLGHDIVRSIAEDREGNLWLGTTNSGLHRVSDSKLATLTGSLASNSIRAVWVDGAGTAWAATDGGGAARADGDRLRAAPFNAALPSPFLRAVRGDSEGNLWIGSIEGLTRVAPDGAATSFDTDDGLPGRIVFALAPRRLGGLWIGTSLGLATIVDGRVAPVDAAGPTDIRALHEAPNGRVWIGERSGLHCLDDGALGDCGVRELETSSVFAFHAASDGAMWLGTSHGLVRLHEGTLRRWGEADGLPDDVVFTILEDDAGAFWLSSNAGIVRVLRRDLEALAPGARVAARTFGKSDGMLSSQGNGASQSPGWKDAEGRLWIATANGVVSIDPAELRGNELAPAVVVERVVVDGSAVEPAKAGALGPGVDRLEFHYAGTSYVAPEAVRYRYRLEGYDRDWVDAGARRTAFYTNLPPGEYAFRALASNNDGVWNETGARVELAIAPRFHETLAFRVLLAVAAALALAGLYRARLARLKANELALVGLVAERTEELRAANAELTRLASLDGLTRIANRGAFDRALTRLWEEHKRRRTPVAVLLCDIDAFKAYNDTYGHQAGDGALIRVAATLAAQAKGPGDVAARYGGEEFALVLGDHGVADAVSAATRVLSAVRTLAIPHRGSTVAGHVTLSIGVASTIPGTSGTLEDLIRAADQALYRAKAEGRNRAVAAA